MRLVPSVTCRNDLHHLISAARSQTLQSQFKFPIMTKSLLLLSLLLLVKGNCAQNNKAQLSGLCTSDNSSLRTILSYPDSVRQMAYMASTYPQGFVRLNELQQSSSSAFRKMASPYCREKEKYLWEVSRYPELPALLIANRYKSKSELKLLLRNYPGETRNAALFSVRHASTLLEMEEIRRDFDNRSLSLIASFPDNVQKAFTGLLKDPELFSTLTNDLATTITLGDIYKSDAAFVNQFGDSVHLALADEERREYEDWKAGINSDPSVQGELKKVSKKYAAETGDEVYGDNGHESRLVINILPYPYWAGYPHWYRHAYWRPYPWWYETGFYWTPGGSFIVTGMPGYRFGWWYYGQPYYYKHFFRTSHYFDRHYQGHPHSPNRFNRGIRDRNRSAPVRAPRTGGRNHPGRR